MPYLTLHANGIHCQAGSWTRQTVVFMCSVSAAPVLDLDPGMPPSWGIGLTQTSIAHSTDAMCNTGRPAQRLQTALGEVTAPEF